MRHVSYVTLLGQQLAQQVVAEGKPVAFWFDSAQGLAAELAWRTPSGETTSITLRYHWANQGGALMAEIGAGSLTARFSDSRPTETAFRLNFVREDEPAILKSLIHCAERTASIPDAVQTAETTFATVRAQGLREPRQPNRMKLTPPEAFSLGVGLHLTQLGRLRSAKKFLRGVFWQAPDGVACSLALAPSDGVHCSLVLNWDRSDVAKSFKVRPSDLEFAVLAAILAAEGDQAHEALLASYGRSSNRKSRVCRRTSKSIAPWKELSQ